MITFKKLEQELILFEQGWRRKSVCPPPNARVRKTHNRQFVVLDDLTKDRAEPLPIVLLVGINYAQGVEKIPDEIIPSSTAVVAAPQDRRLKARIKSAFAHATTHWVHWQDCGLAPRNAAPANLPDDFHIVLSNLSPWITVDWWQRDMCAEAPARGSELLSAPPFIPGHAGWPYDHVEDLKRVLSGSISQWVGHGITTVTPHWHPMVRHLALDNWLLVGNLFAQMFSPELRSISHSVRFASGGNRQRLQVM